MRIHTALVVAAVAAPVATPVLAQSYARVELLTPGGPLPFVVESDRFNPTGRPGGAFNLDLTIINGEERLGGGNISAVPDRYDGLFLWPLESYGSRIQGQLISSTLTAESIRDLVAEGEWVTNRRSGPVRVPLVIGRARGPSDRFDPIIPRAPLTPADVEPAPFGGRWSVDFEDDEDLAVGEFEVDRATGRATGTFLTVTGDYRFLEGRVDGELMRLSAFDGAHAFLFHARMQEDGSIEGDFWSGTWHHETWKAVQDGDASLPDAFGLTEVTVERFDRETLGRFEFTSLEGEPTTLAQVAPPGEPRVLMVFGSWCPNCHDATVFMKELHESYSDEGLKIVGLAFEHSTDPRVSIPNVERYIEAKGVPYEILIAGYSQKDDATESLGFLDRVRSYPTTVFIDRAGFVRAVHQGFTGPATGVRYEQLRERFTEIIESMLED
ncbi:MAG: TlpA disulfide reductase family protein [Planctomycetota bacterium]